MKTISNLSVSKRFNALKTEVKEVFYFLLTSNIDSLKQNLIYENSDLFLIKRRIYEEVVYCLVYKSKKLDCFAFTLTDNIMSSGDVFLKSDKEFC